MIATGQIKCVIAVRRKSNDRGQPRAFLMLHMSLLVGLRLVRMEPQNLLQPVIVAHRVFRMNSSLSVHAFPIGERQKEIRQSEI
jgi:hypothetical protein